ncbi:hypothetical protein ACLOJK_022940 [Asimina triloba]
MGGRVKTHWEALSTKIKRKQALAIKEVSGELRREDPRQSIDYRLALLGSPTYFSVADPHALQHPHPELLPDFSVVGPLALQHPHPKPLTDLLVVYLLTLQHHHTESLIDLSVVGQPSLQHHHPEPLTHFLIIGPPTLQHPYHEL